MTPTTSTARTSTLIPTVTPMMTPTVPAVVPDVVVGTNTININGDIVTLTLSWGEPFNNLDPIVNYTVSCSGDVTCPPTFITTDSTTRSLIFTNLMPVTNYTFSVVATNSIGSGEAGVVMITTPPGEIIHTYVCMYVCMYVCEFTVIEIFILISAIQCMQITMHIDRFSKLGICIK